MKPQEPSAIFLFKVFLEKLQCALHGHRRGMSGTRRIKAERTQLTVWTVSSTGVRRTRIGLIKGKVAEVCERRETKEGGGALS